MFYKWKKVKIAQLCLTVCNSMDYTVHRILQAKILEWVDFPFSRGILPTQGSNPGLYCRRILYQLSHKGSPCFIGHLEFFFGQKPVHIIGPFFYCTICVFPIYRDCSCLSDTNSLPVTWLNFISSKFISCFLTTLWCLVIHKFSISMLQIYQSFLYDRHFTDILRMFSLTWDPKKYFPLKFFFKLHLSNETFFNWSATDFIWCDVGIQFYFFIHINSWPRTIYKRVHYFPSDL